jgi:hypothetical protein
LAASTESGAFAAIRSASSCVRDLSSASGTTSLTSPTSQARAAVIGSPVSRICSAIRGGMSQGSGAAHGAPRPTFTSLIANVACSAATHRSQHWASRKPPAQAIPFTAAIVGLAMSMLRPNWGRKSSGGTVSAVSAISFRSPPAQNALSPAPVSTRTFAPESSLKRRAPANRPSRTAAFSALRASGRSMVSQATPFSTR